MSYFEHDDGIAFEMLNELVSFCNEKNIDIEAFHHECGTNQFELDFVFDSPSKTSDKIIYLKRLISIFAKQKNLVPCFLPKPIKNHSGSGMHINISVFKDKKNLFFEKSNNQKLSDFAYKFAGGIFKHISSICYFANPLKNSYDRLNSGFETPTKIKLSAIDRSALIRVPKSSYQNTRLELRSPDISCNPYLTILAVLISGFDALKVFYTKHGIKSVDINNTSNIYSSFENFNKQWKNSTLPKSIEEAKASFSKDKLLKNIFPKYKLTLN